MWTVQNWQSDHSWRPTVSPTPVQWAAIASTGKTCSPCPCTYGRDHPASCLLAPAAFSKTLRPRKLVTKPFEGPEGRQLASANCLPSGPSNGLVTSFGGLTITKTDEKQAGP